jgi:hypothetical protein
MADPIEVVGEAAFNNAYRVNWSLSGVGNGNPLDITSCRFEFEDDPQVVTVDIGMTSVYLDRSNRAGVMAGFTRNNWVIRADNMAGSAPVHLICEVPILAAGANVSALTQSNKGVGRDYHAFITVQLEGDARRYACSVPFRLSGGFDGAPFLAVRTRPGAPPIEQIWFDVHGDTHVTPEPQQVAINEFWFVE